MEHSKFNISGGGDFAIAVQTPDGLADVTVNFTMAARPGVDLAMVAETAHRFTYAVDLLANGYDIPDDIPAPNYEPCDYNRVEISWADVPITVMDGDKMNMVYKKALIFTETTGVEQFVKFMRWLVDKVDNQMRDMDIIVRDIKPYAKRNGSNGSSNPPPPAAPQPGKSGETPYFEQAPNRQYLGENHDQAVVAIQILKIDVGFKDGQTTYEMFGSYRGDLSQYSFDTTRLVGKKRTGETFITVKDSVTVRYLEQLEMGVHNIKTRGVFWVQKGKQEKTKDNGEKYFPTYLNLNKLDIAHEQAPQAGEESQLPPGGFDDGVPYDGKGDEIPWEAEKPAPENDTPF